MCRFFLVLFCFALLAGCSIFPWKNKDDAPKPALKDKVSKMSSTDFVDELHRIRARACHAYLKKDWPLFHKNLTEFDSLAKEAPSADRKVEHVIGLMKQTTDVAISVGYGEWRLSRPFD